MTQNIEFSDQTLRTQGPYPGSRFTKDVKNAGGTKWSRKGSETTEAAHQSFLATSGLFCPDLHRTLRTVCDYLVSTEGSSFGFETSPVHTQIVT